MALSVQTHVVRRLRVNLLLFGLAAVAAMQDINPECILPMCERVGDQHIGPWETLMVLEDQIVLQVGVAEAAHQAACLNIDIEGVPHRFAQVKTCQTTILNDGATDKTQNHIEKQKNIQTKQHKE